MTKTKATVLTFLMALFILFSMGLLVYGGVTGTIWASSIGLPLLFIWVFLIAYQLSRKVK